MFAVESVNDCKDTRDRHAYTDTELLCHEGFGMRFAGRLQPDNYGASAPKLLGSGGSVALGAKAGS